jgi:hypothetical protein
MSNRVFIAKVRSFLNTHCIIGLSMFKFNIIFLIEVYVMRKTQTVVALREVQTHPMNTYHLSQNKLSSMKLCRILYKKVLSSSEESEFTPCNRFSTLVYKYITRAWIAPIILLLLLLLPCHLVGHTRSVPKVMRMI